MIIISLLFVGVNVIFFFWLVLLAKELARMKRKLMKDKLALEKKEKRKFFTNNL